MTHAMHSNVDVFTGSKFPLFSRRDYTAVDCSACWAKKDEVMKMISACAPSITYTSSMPRLPRGGRACRRHGSSTSPSVARDPRAYRAREPRQKMDNWSIEVAGGMDPESQPGTRSKSRRLFIAPRPGGMCQSAKGKHPVPGKEMTWLRFRLSATLLASTYHQQSPILGVRAFAGLQGARFNSRHPNQVRMSSTAPPEGQPPADGGGSKEGNRLAGETSPYLLQHAHNPVDWMPWGQEAFRRAREEDKPIFLSVGYSTCHWCAAATGRVCWVWGCLSPLMGRRRDIRGPWCAGCRIPVRTVKHCSLQVCSSQNSSGVFDVEATSKEPAPKTAVLLLEFGGPLG